MNTLAEVEAVAETLAPAEREELARRLLAKSHTTLLPVISQADARRKKWVERLDRLRTRGVTGITGVSLQEIFDDLRG